MQAHLDTTQAWNVPMLLGEFAQFGWSDTLGWQADMKMMFDFCKQNNINWTYFSYQDSGRSLIDVHTGLVHDTLVRALNAGMCGAITGVSIQSVAKNIVTIYPNPFNSIVNIELPVSNCKLKIFDMLGNIVFEKTLNSKHEILNFNLPGGMYFYQITDNKQFISTGKIVAE